MTELAPVSKAKQAITKATTPDEANEIRSRLKAIQKYLVSRRRSYETAWEAAKLQCEAAAKAGELWAVSRPGERARTDIRFDLPSWEGAGFAHRMDATICVRIGELNPQDRELYYEDMAERRRYPSEGGLYSVWHTLRGDLAYQGVPAYLRWEVWERDDFRCRACGIRRFLSIDHIVPRIAGGSDESANLQTLCEECNSRKGDR